MRLPEAMTKSTIFDEDITGTIQTDTEELDEAAELLYDLVHESTQFAYNVLETDVNGSWKGITSIYYDCRDMIKRIAEGGPKTAFLAMSALEDAYAKIEPLLLVRLESILDGSSKMPEKARRLKEILRDNQYKTEWEATSSQYAALIARIGLPADMTDYSDLTSILDPLLDALTFFDRAPRLNKPLAFRLGPAGDPKSPPAFSLHVPIFRSEKDLVLSCLSCDKENAIMFAGLELTYGDTDDKFYSWYTGFNNERMQNVMRNENLTKEQYAVTIDQYSREIYLCVKTGKTLYLTRMPYRRESYGGSAFNDETKYCYGHRASYAPYQAFYDEPPAAPEDTTFLAVPRKGYRLADIMDPAQKAWLPAFLNEAWTHFFKNGPVEAVDAYLQEERALMMPGQTIRTDQTHDETPARPATAIVKARLCMTVPDPADLFDQPFMKTLIREFNITADDIMTHRDTILYGQAFKELDLDQRLRMAAIKLLCDKVAPYLKDANTAKHLAHAKLFNAQTVTERIISGACAGFTTLSETSNSITDTRSEAGLTAIWYGPPTRGAPPVLYRVRPVTAEDHAILLGMEVTDLPDPLRLYTEILQFWKAYRETMPRSVSYNETVRPRHIVSLNLCMSKTSHKQALKQFTNKKA